ncbi:hypothetical protein [Varibaculum cambriense]|uniref:hypothetical protein n=1 Tax=Varibaculum cambriense TaxID=184870 RepID=UPI0025574F4E|nr:hypothetical protein [Varibaculum cambriense]
MISDDEKSELITHVLEPARKSIKKLAQNKYPQDFKQQNLYRVALTTELLKALKIFLDWMGAEAANMGAEIAEVGAATGGSVSQGNVRRRMPHMRTFEAAIAGANNIKKPVTVTINGWNIIVNPDNWQD